MIRGVDIFALAITLAIAAVGGAAAWALHLPLGFLLGALVVTAVLAVLGARPFGKPVTLPPRLRFSFVPVIGVSIGGAFTPEVAQAALGWGPTLAALCVFVPLAHLAGYGLFRWGGLPKTEAFFGAVPGGLLESIQLGEEAGADVRLLTVLHFLRLIGTIVAIPMLFWGITGHTVGSASGVTLARAALTPGEAVLLVVAGLAGVGIGRALRFPAWIMTGPLAASAALHGFGQVEGGTPGWLVAVTQVVLGCGLGARFAGIDHAILIRAGRLAALNGVVALSLALGFATALHWAVGEPVAAVFLAFAPGGLAEMGLIALSLKMSVIFVTVHHVARIILSVTVARIGARWLA